MTETKNSKMLDEGGKSVVALIGSIDGSHLRVPAQRVHAFACIDDHAC